MQTLSQSAFLQALGYAIANSLWQAALLWVLAAVCNSLVKLPSPVKYKVALTAQFGTFAWFLVTLRFYYERCSEAIAQLQYAGLNNSNALVLRPGMHSFASAMLSVILKGEMLLPYLSIAYLCLLIAMAVRWIKGYRQTQLIKTTGLQKIDVEWRLFVKRIAEMLGIKQQVHIYISELVKSPLTLGFLKPLILVPLASINSLSTYQLEAIILHELAHIKRADYFINIIQSIIETALFFNPFTQLLSKMIKRERENSCDDWVLQFQYDPSKYAEALLRIAYIQQSPALAMNAAGKETDLLWRVKRMLNQQQRSFQYRNRLVALLMITGILTSVAWFHPDEVKIESAKQPEPNNQAVVVEPMSTKIDNPWFNPVSFLNKPLQAEVDKAVEDAKAGLQASTQLALSKAGEVVEKSLKTVNINMPQITLAAGTAANSVLKNINVTDMVNVSLKGLKDSLNVSNIINLAINKGLKNVDWKGFALSQDELKKELSDKSVMAGAEGSKLKEVILTSLNEVKNTIFKVKTDEGDNNTASSNDGDDDAPEITAPDATLKAPANNKVREEKRKLKLLEASKKADSLRRVLSRIKLSDRQAAGLYTRIEAQFTQQANTAGNAVGAGYSYTTPGLMPVKFDDQTLPYKLSVGKANDVTVTSNGSSTLVAVKEDTENTDSYKKRITIETLDSTGQRHTYHVTFEMYQ